MVTESKTPISSHVMNQMAAFFFLFFYIQERFYDEEESLGPPVSSSSLFSESLCVGAAPSDDSTLQNLPLSEFQLVL